MPNHTTTAKRIAAVAILGLLTACVEPNAVVSDYNGDSVKIQTSTFVSTEQAKAATLAEASRICSKGSKKRAEYASTRQLPQYVQEHLYLCI